MAAQTESTSSTAPRIALLEATDVNRICSGQVITQLSTAVKELLENALDAGANTVDIRLTEYGAELIEIVDNGSGIKEEDFEWVAVKSATSKISAFDDVYGVKTFGFRGEALAALCELSSSVTIITRCADQEVGTELSYSTSGKLISRKPVPRSVGTTVRVREIFSKLPVRHREFLRALKQQYAKLLITLQAYGVSATNVRIIASNLVNGSSTDMLANLTRVTASVSPAATNVTPSWKGKEGGKRGDVSRQSVMTTSGTGVLQDAIADVFGVKFLDTLQPVECDISLSDEAVARVNGYVSKAGTGVGRQNNDKQFICINKRPVDLPKISKTFNEVWRQFEMGHKPAYIVNLELPSTMYDINISPDKREVLLGSEADIIDQLKSALFAVWEPSRRTFKQAPMVAPLWPSNTLVVNSPDDPSEQRDVDLAKEAEEEDGEVGQQEDITETTALTASAVADITASLESFGAANTTSISTASSNTSTSRIVTHDRNEVSDDVMQKRNAVLMSLTKSSKSSAARDITSIIAKRSAAQHRSFDNGATQAVATVLQPPSVQEELSDDNEVEMPARRTVFTSPKHKTEALPQTNHSATPVTSSSTRVIASTEANQSLVDTNAHEEVEIVLEEGHQHCCNNDDELEILEPEATTHKPSAAASQPSIASSQAGSVEVVSGFKRPKAAVSDRESVPLERIQQVYQQRRALYKQYKSETTTDKHGISLHLIELADIHALFGNSAANRFNELHHLHLFADPTDEITAAAAPSMPNKLSSEDDKQVDDGIKPLAEVNGATGVHSVVACAQPQQQNIAAKTALEATYSRVLHQSSFVEMSRRVFGQFNLGFIIAGVGNDLFILDQHACDEKYRFEHLQEHTIIHEQRLLVARPIDLTAAEEHCIMEHMHVFNANGFHFQSVENALPGRRLQLSAIPFSKNTTFGDDDVRELASLLSESRVDGAMVRLPKATSMFASRACRSAVMIGTALGRDRMRRIVAQLAELQQPWNCPHGRPTLRHLIDVSRVKVTLAESGPSTLP